MHISRLNKFLPWSAPSLLVTTLDRAYTWVGVYGRAARALAVPVLPALFLLRSRREEVYNVLWALVFAFATLNILSLGARQFETDRKGLTFGEVLAVMVVFVSVVMLGWEVLYLFKVFPLHLAPR